MIVAQLRGVVFNQNFTGEILPNDWHKAWKALDDVARWLGFRSSRDGYLHSLPIEREKIFLRAKDKK